MELVIGGGPSRQVDYNRWHAEAVEESGEILNATLRITADTPVYHQIAACISGNDQVEATVTSPGKNTPSFGINSYLFRKETPDSVKSRAIILTYGATIIGLCFGPLLHQKNF